MERRPKLLVPDPPETINRKLLGIPTRFKSIISAFI